MPRSNRIYPLPAASSFNEEILQNQPMDTLWDTNSGKRCDDYPYLIPMPRYPWGLGYQIRHELHGRLYSAPFWLLPLLYVYPMPIAQLQLANSQFPGFLTNNIIHSLQLRSRLAASSPSVLYFLGS